MYGYSLPHSGESLAFGSASGNSRIVDLWTSVADGDDIEVRFIPTVSGQRPEEITGFGSFELRVMDSALAPVAIESLLPFQVVVRTQVPALLESPREFMPGYTATVDGRPSEVLRSDEGLVEVQVPSGNHKIALIFKAPILLAASYWVAILAWVSILPIAAFPSAHTRN